MVPSRKLFLNNIYVVYICIFIKLYVYMYCFIFIWNKNGYVILILYYDYA